MFMIIMFWGNNPERIEALNYFMIYSLVGSLPLLRSIIIGRDNLRRMGLLSWRWTHLVRDVYCHIDDMNSVYTIDELNEGVFRWIGEGSRLVHLFYGFTIPHFFLNISFFI